ncbi:MAG: tetratricopeptide repeat protein [Planctomycetaceae bacterium]|nr:tetratricopeptide repeat protein [Planctomycetaceae bacterium]
MKRMDHLWWTHGWVFTACCLIATPIMAQTDATQGVAAQPVSVGQVIGIPAAGNTARQQVDALYAQATTAKTIEELTQALGLAKQITPQDPQTRDYLKNLTAWLHNRRGEMLTQMAHEQTKAGKPAEAATLEEQAVQEFTASTQLKANGRAFHNRGVSLATQGKFKEAIDDFSQCLAMNPSYTNARFNRAELFLELGQYEESENDYSRVISAQPTDSAALIGRGHVRFYRGQFEDSLMDFDDAIARDPGNALAYADRADLYSYLGRWEPAARDYRMAIRIDGNLGRAYQSAAWLMATCPDDRFRDPQLALRAAKRAIDLEGSRDYRYLDTLAAAQANAGLYPQAQQSLQQALQAAPREVVVELEERMTLYQANRPYRDVPR